MSEAMLDQVIKCQASLLLAIDSRDAITIERASAELSHALSAVRAQSVWKETANIKDQISYALKQPEAARMRVNYLSQWTRQRIDRLTELRGESSFSGYGKAGKTGAF